MNNPDISKQLILRLLYSDVFQHPLNQKELERMIDADPNDVARSINELVEKGLVGEQDGYYFIFEEKDKVQRRNLGNSKAQGLMPKAHKVGRKIYRFPYVKGVAISGSLSKGVLHEDGDFDYFIVTQPGRLWVARTLLILYKKVFLLNSRKYFCVNYFIDTNNLEIEEKNPFTATEVATLLPVAGEVMEEFFEQNSWIGGYAKEQKREPHFDQVKKPALTKFMVFTTKGRFGDWMDRRFMRMTLKRWERKFGEFDSNTFDLAMKSRKYVSKHHPNNFQEKVLRQLEDVKERYRNLYKEQLNQLGIEL